jgi:hypothetical protein
MPDLNILDLECNNSQLSTDSSTRSLRSLGRNDGEGVVIRHKGSPYITAQKQASHLTSRWLAYKHKTVSSVFLALIYSDILIHLTDFKYSILTND